MYGFTITVLLAALVAKLTDFARQSTGDRIPRALTNLLALALAIGAVEALQFSLFRQWGVGVVGEGWNGILFTGGLVYGLSAGVRGIYELLSGAAKHRSREAPAAPERPRVAA